MSVPTSLDDYVARAIVAAPPLSAEQMGRLSGIVHKRSALSPPIDWAPKTATTVYRHFDSCGCLLYIGVAYDAVKRTYAHAGSSWWAKWTERIEMDKVTYDVREDALEAERAAIATESPVFNKTHAPDRDRAVIRYLIAHERWEHLSVPALVEPVELPGLLRTLANANLLGGIEWLKEPRR